LTKLAEEFAEKVKQKAAEIGAKRIFNANQTFPPSPLTLGLKRLQPGCGVEGISQKQNCLSSRLPNSSLLRVQPLLAASYVAISSWAPQICGSHYMWSRASRSRLEWKTDFLLHRKSAGLSCFVFCFDNSFTSTVF
jgi:hypothetical protein